MRYPIVNLGQQAWTWPLSPREEEEVVVVAPRRRPLPPPPTPPLSFMMPLRQGPEPPEPPPGPPMPPPPPLPPVATPGSAQRGNETVICYRCPDGSYKRMSIFDARYNNPENCRAVDAAYCADYPQDPGEPTVSPRVEDLPPVATGEPGRIRIPTRPMTPTPITSRPPTPPPLPVYEDVATEGAGFPTSTGFAPPPQELPRYTDVATPSTPQYGTDLQRQIDSYSEKLKEFYDRPAAGQPVATQSAGDQYNLTKKFAPQSNQYNLTPSSMRPGSGPCPPGQFLIDPAHPEKGCRGGVATGGLPGLPGGLPGGAATITPGSLAPTGGVATSFAGMGRRYPVVNL